MHEIWDLQLRIIQSHAYPPLMETYQKLHEADLFILGEDHALEGEKTSVVHP